MKAMLAAALLLGVTAAAQARAQAPAAPAAPAAARPPTPPARGPAFALALEAANAAIKSCAGLPVAVVVLDKAGLPKLYDVPDGSNGARALMAFRKANTALLIGAPTEESVARGEADPALKAKLAGPEYVANAGGLPITVNGEVIGALAVAGAGPSAKDKACAEDGLKAVQSRLK